MVFSAEFLRSDHPVGRDIRKENNKIRPVSVLDAGKGNAVRG
jgi:hypothetical protein